MGIEKYKLDCNPVAPKEAMICGDTWRITVLTAALIRLEYSEDGVFEDRATQSVLNRDFPVCPFSVEDGEELKLFTDSIELRYDKKAFSPSGLCIKVNAGKGRTWHFGEEPKDLLGTARTLDNTDGANVIDNADWYEGKNSMHDEYKGKLQLSHGILSREGYSYFDDSKSMVLLEDGWIAPRKDGITDIYFFAYGFSYLEALKDFYHLCGAQPLLPRYAFGNWWSRYHRYTEQEYMDLVQRFEYEKIPFSVSVVDMDWHLVDDVNPKYGSGWTGYTWNRKFFPDPERFMHWLHEHNLKITLNVHPADGIRAYEELYEPVAVAMGIDPKSEIPVECDLADPKFVETYFKELHHPLERQGVDFWWVDWQQGTVTKQENLDPLWVLNHYHYLDSSWKGNRRITFSRYAGVGSHRYPVGFSGDTVISWQSLDFQPWFTSTASNIGYGWWSHDIGGHMLGKRDDELATRWVQYGVFSPINRLHSSDNPFTGKEPWKFNAIACDIMKRFLQLRHSLIPYLYSMNRRANRDGEPLVWPLYYAEPRQRIAYEMPNEYYFGSELLCAPITKPQDPVAQASYSDVWIPDGIWVDFFNGMFYQGNRKMSLWRGLESFPVLMKQGAIIPMKNMDEYDNSTANPSAMEVRVFVGKEGKFTLWEDEGDTPEDINENWAWTNIALEKSGVQLHIYPAEGNQSILPEKRSWKIVLYGAEGNSVHAISSGEEIRAKCTRDPDTGILTVQIPEQHISSDILIEICKQEQLGNELENRCFSVLEKAQTDYEEKRAVLNLIRERGKDAVASLTSLHLQEAVFEELLEILTAI